MGIILNENLLFTDEIFDFISALNGTSALGLYNSMQFVLRLRDDIRKALDKEEIDEEKIQAFSTSIHENIHWWQHIGSNFGFLLSLSYPVYSTSIIGPLKDLISKNILYKSILLYDKLYTSGNEQTKHKEINSILNNYYDWHYAKLFAYNNENINDIANDRRFFLNIGHCYNVFLGKSIASLYDIAGKKCNPLPNVEKWQDEFKKLGHNKIEGFYEDSPVSISPLGIHAIFEGQARFIQIQYLASAFKLDFEDFVNRGMLNKIYGEAFRLFLDVTGFKKPTSPLNNIVGLFLLICDISINPNNGFPLDVYDYPNFVIKNDPGLRFFLFCQIIAKKPNHYLEKINLYTKDEYIELCNELCVANGCISSYKSMEDVLIWFKGDEIKSLLLEESKMEFKGSNLPIRLLFSKYLRFQEDKYEYPHIFCWLGYHSVSDNARVDFELTKRIFLKHHALYRDDYDGEIKAVLHDGYPQENIVSTFNNFYKYNIVYDLILKWVSEAGPFKYQYGWLTNAKKSEFVPEVKKAFKEAFNIYPDQIKILPIDPNG